MIRAYGDNGKPDDNYVKDILSPYPADHSALSDAAKLRFSTLQCRKAVLLYGFEYPDRPLKPLIHALEALLEADGPIGVRSERGFTELIHPIHLQGSVVAWEVLG
jgi:hypothetical protein